MTVHVYSDPFKTLVGRGKNGKYVNECKEMYLGGQNIDRLTGFERFVALEILWLNDNELTAVTGLEENFRIKELYLHNNKICTLRGSLSTFKFLDTLDLGNNQIKDLGKTLAFLNQFNFLRILNLRGNPVTEEPDYRTHVILKLPQVQILDEHVVTPFERRTAKKKAGDVALNKVAFGLRALVHDAAWDEKVPERSRLQQDLIKEVAGIKERIREGEEEEFARLFSHDPFSGFPTQAGPLPLPPGLLKAQAAFEAKKRAEAEAAAAAAPPSSTGASPGDVLYKPKDKIVTYGCKLPEQTGRFRIPGSGTVSFTDSMTLRSSMFGTKGAAAAATLYESGRPTATYLHSYTGASTALSTTVQRL